MKDRRSKDATHEALKGSYDLECLLVGELSRLLEEPKQDHLRLPLLLILDRLRWHLPRQLRLAGGPEYLGEIPETCPHWQGRIDSLRRANLDSISLLSRVSDRVVHELPFVSIATDVSRVLKQWVRSLHQIRQKERRLLQAAFTFDVGGEA